MDRKKLMNAIGQITVPKEKVFQAIEQGLEKANNKDTKPRVGAKRVIFAGMTAVSLFAITLGSGFVIPDVNKVLAKAPIIGAVYKEFGDSMGYNLAKQNLVTKLNQSLTRNGVTVKLTDAYFDGNVISIIGHVDGDISTGNEKGEVSFDLNFENHKGDSDPWLNGFSTDIHKKGNGYDFAWNISYPYKTIKESFTLPLSIHYINGAKGDWNFDIPIRQKQVAPIAIQQSKSYTDDDIKIVVKDILAGQASASIVFETVGPYKNDHIDIFKGIDNKGKELFNYANNTILSSSKEKDGYHLTLRKSMNELDPEATSITFYPQMEMADPEVGRLMDTDSFTLKSKRTDMAIKVNSIKQKGNKLILDYNFLGLPNKHSPDQLDILVNNLHYEFRMIDKDYVSKVNPDNPFPPKDHGIGTNQVTLLDKKTARFQSVFNLKGKEQIKNFKLQHTVLQFNFSSFIEAKKLAPFTVKLRR